MPPHDLAPVIIVTVLTLTVGGVMLLRPLSNQLGNLLKAMAAERQNQAPLEGQLHQMRDLLENLDSRMALIEKKQDFTDQLLNAGSREPEALPVEAPRTASRSESVDGTA